MENSFIQTKEYNFSKKVVCIVLGKAQRLWNIKKVGILCIWENLWSFFLIWNILVEYVILRWEGGYISASRTWTHFWDWNAILTAIRTSFEPNSSMRYCFLPITKDFWVQIGTGSCEVRYFSFFSWTSSLGFPIDHWRYFVKIISSNGSWEVLLADV